jgi:ketose-bisphosphate aldolase
MPLVPMTRMLRHAQENRYAIGYFESWNLESLLAVKDAAEKTGSPVIIGFNGGFLGNPRRPTREDIRLYGTMGRTVAERSCVPMALILNEATEMALLREGMDAGFNVVMLAGEGFAQERLIQLNRELVEAAHPRGVEVEAELGELPSADIGTRQVTGGNKTDPAEAQRFVQATGVDALAVAIGNVHMLEDRKSSLDFPLLEELRTGAQVPLVLHGGTGIDETELRKAIRAGVCKVNVGTMLRRSFVNSLKTSLQGSDIDRLDPGELTSTGGSRDVLARARADVAAEVVRFMQVLGSENRAAALV